LGNDVPSAWENPMSHARKLSLEWAFVVALVAAIILAAAGGATIYSLVHRPVAALHPPVAESVAAPTLSTPEASRSMTTDAPVAAQQPTEPQEVKSPAEAAHIPRWGVWLASDVSESMAWTLYRKRARQFASLIGDREPVVLFRQLPGLGNAKRYVIAIVDDDRAQQILQEAHRRRQHLQRNAQRDRALTSISKSAAESARQQQRHKPTAIKSLGQKGAGPKLATTD
jgi:hypothetical protein